jgi:hypothetical protein
MQADIAKLNDQKFHAFPGRMFRAVFLVALLAAAALQSAQRCANPVLIRIETRAGHGEGKPSSMVLDEQSDVLASMWDTVAGAEKR